MHQRRWLHTGNRLGRFGRHLPERGPALLARLQPHFPDLLIMLVSIEDNGFRAFATFQTSELLALVQLEHVKFVEIDIDAGAADRDVLPF